jgi:hypothetical protein
MTKKKSQASAPGGAPSSTPPSPPSGENGTPPIESAELGETSSENQVSVDASQGPDRKPGFLSSLLDQDTEGAPEPVKRGRGRPRKDGGPVGAKSFIKLTREQLTSVVLVPIVVFLTSRAWRDSTWPEEAKPLEDEIEAFCMPGAEIILRHTPAVAASPDVLNLFQMAMAGWRWWQRAKPLLDAAADRADRPKGEESHATERSNGRPVRPVIESFQGYTRAGLYAGGG